MFVRNTIMVVLAALAVTVLVMFVTPATVEQRVEQQISWAQFTYDYSDHQWCVDAQRRDAAPGQMVGGCFRTFREAEEGILK